MANQAQDAAPKAGPLAGLRVLDLTRVLSGPWAAQTLGDLGAEVIKIERPETGDEFRAAPPYMKDADGRPVPQQSSLYLSANRNKKSVCVDLAREEGRALIRQFAVVCDIVIENFRGGFMQRVGLGYDALSASNRGLIYCAISGFGQSGPLAQKGGFDSTFQSISGMMSFTGQPDGSPGEGPLRTGPSFCDLNAAMYGVVSILAALHHRGQTGQGQFIDLGMLDTTLAMLSHHAMGYLVAGEQPTRVGNGSPFSAPVNVFRCRDRRAMINAGRDEHFLALCQILRCPELPTDARFATKEARLANAAALFDLIEARTREWNCDDLLPLLEAQAMPVAPVNEIGDALANPQVAHRGMLREVPHPLAGSMKMLASPMNFSHTPLERYEAPPLLGQHTDDVLAGVLGLPAEKIAALRAAGIVS